MNTNVVEANPIVYEVLNSFDKELIAQTADCLSETFIGYQVGELVIREPMCYAGKIYREDFHEFVLEYLNSVVEQGYCFIAKEQHTGKVIGAYACEIFDPANEEVPVFEGSFEPFNHIINLLGDLDVRFIEKLEKQIGRTPEINEYLHAFMLGVRTEINRKEIANKLIEMSLEKAEAEGLKGCFLEATSFKSQVILTKYFDFYLPTDVFGNEIVTKYAETEAFNSIPLTIGEDCQILYKPLNGTERI